MTWASRRTQWHEPPPTEALEWMCSFGRRSRFASTREFSQRRSVTKALFRLESENQLFVLPPHLPTLLISLRRPSSQNNLHTICGHVSRHRIGNWTTLAGEVVSPTQICRTV